MKILHTSDWHLGRTLHGTDLSAHHADFADWLVGQVTERGVDVVVIPGDVYDRAIPPLDAVRLLDRTLARLAEQATVILTPGNHDSATRLGFGRELMRDGVHLLTDVAGIDHPVSVADEHGEVLLFGLPYLEPDMARVSLAGGGEPLARSHEAVTRAALDRVRERAAAHPGARTVVLAHTFVTGGSGSDSERDLRIGGVDSVGAGVLGGIDYLALGHLHGCQDLTALVGAPAWYSGSPLAFSFSEKDHRKAVLMVEMGAGGVTGVERIAAPVPRRLVELRGTLEEVLAQAPQHTEDWARVIITDPVRPPHLQETLRGALPHLLLTEHQPAGAAPAGAAPAIERTADPVEVMEEFLAHVTGTPATAEQHTVLEEALAAVRQRQAEATS